MFGLAIWDVREETAGRGARRHGHQTHLLSDLREPVDFRFRNSRDPGGGRLPDRRWIPWRLICFCDFVTRLRR